MADVGEPLRGISLDAAQDCLPGLPPMRLLEFQIVDRRGHHLDRTLCLGVRLSAYSERL